MMVLVTGGSGSGKSEYAENLLCRCSKEEAGQLVYVATMLPYGRETRLKIERHRQMRCGKGFETVECYTNLAGLAERLREYGSCSVLLECISNLAANELYEEEGAGEGAADAVLRGIEAIRVQARHVVVVTNEVNAEGFAGCGLSMQKYRQVMGEINCRLAAMADRVTEVVYGIAVEVKTGL